MLYKIEEQAEAFEKLEPVEFKDFSSFGKLEKDLGPVELCCLIFVLLSVFWSRRSTCRLVI